MTAPKAPVTEGAESVVREYAGAAAWLRNRAGVETEALARVCLKRCAALIEQQAEELRRREDAREWRCFQCDELFTNEACAREHFGDFQDCLPICKVGAERYRDLENQLAAFRSESDEASKTFYRLGGDHAQRERRAEEKGYERGLRDATDMRWLALADDDAALQPPPPASEGQIGGGE